MTVTLTRDLGWISQTGSATPSTASLSTLAVGDTLVLWAVSKFDTAVLTPPSGQGWTQVFTGQTTGVTEVGNGDQGDIRVECWAKVWDGVAVGSWSFTGDVWFYRLAQIRPTTGYQIALSGLVEGGTTTLPDPGRLGVVSGDIVHLVVGLNGNAVTSDLVSVSSTGFTLTGLDTITSASSSLGTDMTVYDRPFTASLVSNGNADIVTGDAISGATANTRCVVGALVIREAPIPTVVAGTAVTETDTATSGSAVVLVAGYGMGYGGGYGAVADVPVSGAAGAETDSAATGTVRAVVAGTGAVEADAAAPGTSAAAHLGGAVSELDVAATGALGVVVAGTAGAEVDAAVTGTADVIVVLNDVPGIQAVEVDTALAGAPAFPVLGTTAIETDLPAGGLVAVALPGTAAVEVDVATSGAVGAVLVGAAAVEADLALTGGAGLAVPGLAATEADVAFLAGIGIHWDGATATEADAAATGGLGISGNAGVTAAETDIAHAGVTIRLDRNIELSVSVELRWAVSAPRQTRSLPIGVVNRWGSRPIERSGAL